MWWHLLLAAATGTGPRLTESRLPEGISPDDLGQAVVSEDEKYALISTLTTPIRVGEGVSCTVDYYVFINEPDQNQLDKCFPQL